MKRLNNVLVAVLFAVCALCPGAARGAPVGLPFAGYPPITPDIKGKVPDDVTPAALMEFLRAKSEDVLSSTSKYNEIAAKYETYGKEYGLRWDWAFFQMLHETSYLRFGNLVDPSQNNFAGIGARGPGVPGNTFRDVPTGVHAHVQHLAVYAGILTTRDKDNLVAPRTKEIVSFRSGVARNVEDLSAKWATSPQGGKFYGQMIAQIAAEFGSRYQADVTPDFERFLKTFVQALSAATGWTPASLSLKSDGALLVVRPYKKQARWVRYTAERKARPVVLDLAVRMRPLPVNNVDRNSLFASFTGAKVEISADPTDIRLAADGTMTGSATVKTTPQSTAGPQPATVTRFEWAAKPLPDRASYDFSLKGKGVPPEVPPIFRLKLVP